MRKWGALPVGFLPPVSPGCYRCLGQEPAGRCGRARSMAACSAWTLWRCGDLLVEFSLKLFKSNQIRLQRAVGITSSLSVRGSSSDTEQSLYSCSWSEGRQLCPEPDSGHWVPSKDEDQEGGNPHRIATPVDRRGQITDAPASVYSHKCGQTSCVHSPMCMHCMALCAPPCWLGMDAHCGRT